MTPDSGSGNGGSGFGGRVAIAIGLLVLNLGLLLLNLDKHSLLPFSFGGGTTAGEGTDAAADPSTGSTPSTQAGQSTSLTLAVTEDVEITDTTVDDWPGGRGPVPEGPPVARVAKVTPDGRLELTGSVPNWATALKIVEFAGANLPGGSGSVDNNLTWHPDASADTQSGVVVMDQAANFTVGGTEIDPASTGALDLAAAILNSRPSLFVVITGHTDDVGDEELNAELALERANAVVDYLISQGVIPGQLVVASAGEDDPFASNETEAGREGNRRIELRFENFLIPPQTFG